MTKEEILWKHVSDLYAKEPAEIRKYSKEELEKTPEYQMMLQAMEEYAQLQAAAPLSEEWKEPIYQELNTGGYGISARDAHKLTLFIGRVIEENVVKQLQAENTRLKAYALTLEDRLTQMEAQAAQPAMEDCCVNSCDGFKCESGSIHKVAAQPPAAGEAVAWIAAERIRQVEKEGWTQEHDDEHTWGEMAIAAACYALHHTDASVKNPHTTNLNGWPWAEMWWKPSVDKIKNLVRAGALIAAEIDRISRQDAQTKGGTE